MGINIEVVHWGSITSNDILSIVFRCMVSKHGLNKKITVQYELAKNQLSQNYKHIIEYSGQTNGLSKYG